MIGSYIQLLFMVGKTETISAEDSITELFLGEKVSFQAKVTYISLHVIPF